MADKYIDIQTDSITIRYRHLNDIKETLNTRRYSTPYNVIYTAERGIIVRTRTALDQTSVSAPHINGSMGLFTFKDFLRFYITDLHVCVHPLNKNNRPMTQFAVQKMVEKTKAKRLFGWWKNRVSPKLLELHKPNLLGKSIAKGRDDDRITAALIEAEYGVDDLKRFPLMRPTLMAAKSDELLTHLRAREVVNNWRYFVAQQEPTKSINRFIDRFRWTNFPPSIIKVTRQNDLFDYSYNWDCLSLRFLTSNPSFLAQVPNVRWSAEGLKRARDIIDPDMDLRKKRELRSFGGNILDYLRTIPPQQKALIQSPVRLARESHEWHMQFRGQNANLRNRQTVETYDPDLELPRPSVDLENKYITLLRTPKDLAKEGSKMQHCVATYIDGVADGKFFIYHVDYKGSEATLAIRPSVDYKVKNQPYVVHQCLGPRNKENAASRYAQEHVQKVLSRRKEVVYPC